MSDIQNQTTGRKVVNEKRAKQASKGIHAFSVLVSSLVLAGIAAIVLLAWAMGWL